MLAPRRHLVLLVFGALLPSRAPVTGPEELDAPDSAPFYEHAKRAVTPQPGWLTLLLLTPG